MQVQSGSGEYFTLLAAVFFLYWAFARARLPRLAVVLFANAVFCAHFGLFYVILIPACSTADYLIGLGLMRFDRAATRKLLLGLSVAMNLTLLIGSRHAGAFLDHRWEWIFPLGLSFYTFQSLSYTIDLYRRDEPGTRSLLTYLSAASFFPTLQAGPIARLTDLTQRLDFPKLNPARGGQAFFLIGMGLLKKALIADYLSENLVNRVFDTPNLYSGVEVLLGVYAYSLQLYFDFSAYTDIARGAGLLLGVELPANFDRPYLSANIAEFWRRWHISFSNWLRDYLYFSLPGVRGKVLPYVNLVITMVIGGLWHGIAWTFAIWGLLHGLALAVVRGWQAWRGKGRESTAIGRAAAVFVTYQFVCLTWIFFRAGSVSNAMTILARIGSLTGGVANVSAWIAAVLALASASIFFRKSWYLRAEELFARSPFYVHAAGLAAIVVALELLGGRGSAPFVYSRF